jgi:hypothetical protein
MQGLWGVGDGTLVFCGKSGWYDDGFRDTDWFTLVLGAAGVAEVTIEAERGTYFFELWPQDCEEVGVAQLAQAPACDSDAMTITGAPGDLVWTFVAPDAFEPPYDFEGHEYDYVLTLTGIENGPVATRAASWSRVRALYR